MKKYEITPEHRIELERIKQKYIDNALRTDAMTEFDKEQMRVSARGMYKNAGLPYPGDDKVIFVGSPLIAQFASAIAMALLHGTKTCAENAASSADSAARHAEDAAHAAESAVWSAESAARGAASAAESAVWSAAVDAARDAANAVEHVAQNATENAGESAALSARNSESAAEDAARNAAERAASAAHAAKNVAENATENAAENAERSAARNAADNAENAARAAREAAWDAAEDAAEGVENEVINAAEGAAIDVENAVEIALDNAASAAEDASRAAWSAEINKKTNSLDIFLSAFIHKTQNYGVLAKQGVAEAWRYRRRTALWPYYQVFGEFFKDIAKLPGEWEKWDPLNLECLHGGVVFMTPDFTIVSDRPELLKIDNDKQLHCENGPAVKWRDGMEQYYWHGTSVPDYWIKHRELLTPDIALTWENVEQRRAACEILGWENVLEHPSLNKKIIDEDDPSIGTLITVRLPDVGNVNFLAVTCGTGRKFVLYAPDDAKTALEANARIGGWTGEGDPMKHIPFIRT